MAAHPSKTITVLFGTQCGAQAHDPEIKSHALLTELAGQLLGGWKHIQVYRGPWVKTTPQVGLPFPMAGATHTAFRIHFPTCAMGTLAPPTVCRGFGSEGPGQLSAYASPSFPTASLPARC